MTSYRRISSKTLNREVNNNGNIDIYMNPIGKGVYPSNPTTIDAIKVTVTNDEQTGNALSISANALTTGNALSITSSSTSKTTNGLVNIAQTGATTTQSTPTLTVSTTATTNTGAGAASFSATALTLGNAVSISATALTTGSALRINGTANKMAISLDGVSRFNGGSITQGATVYTAGGAKSITALELINGFAYIGAPGGAVLLTFPGASTATTGVQAVLAAMGITSAAGTRLPPIIVSATGANNLTVTGGTGDSISGTAAINNKTAIIHYIFTGATTAAIVVTTSV